MRSAHSLALLRSSSWQIHFRAEEIIDLPGDFVGDVQFLMADLEDCNLADTNPGFRKIIERDGVPVLNP